MSVEIPSKFLTSLENNIGKSESRALVESLDTPSPTSVRFNPYKIGEKPEGEQVPWSKYGFYLEERPIFTIDPLFHSGSYYVQEASSMFLEHVYNQAIGDESQLRILDLCAAPGGKSTHLASLAGLDSVVVSNEVIRPRAKILAENVAKWGLGNVVVTNNDPSHFSKLANFFDVIVVDAPCSGEGMFRKTPEARGEWSESNVKLCAARQQRILSDIWGSLRNGGVLIYSTCTFNRTENEDNIKWLCENYDCEAIDIAVDDNWGVVKGEVDGINTFRFYPHRVKGEGFFMAVLRKSGSNHKDQKIRYKKATLTELPKQQLQLVAQWCNQAEFMRFGSIADGRIFGYYAEVYDLINIIADNLGIVYSGVEMGQIMGGKLKPEHSLALFHDVSHELIPDISLPLFEALHYLRKNDLPAELFEEGLNMVCYEGFPIGFIKRIGNRCNNLYPKEYRIQNK